jgi:hypothetical protein
MKKGLKNFKKKISVQGMTWSCQVGAGSLSCNRSGAHQAHSDTADHSRHFVGRTHLTRGRRICCHDREPNKKIIFQITSYLCKNKKQVAASAPPPAQNPTCHHTFHLLAIYFLFEIPSNISFRIISSKKKEKLHCTVSQQSQFRQKHSEREQVGWKL